ncbi:type I-F CRISPR-associated endoribonuclease Cas6/Csy4 [Acinetobacter bereziniae]|uniref:CRISPR-associated protein cas6/csy4, subtype I-f/ypest n=1 Tax=Acinetobacter bereziniae NIPH 3 TaxID=1217651 RepID=N8YUP6_ACIBZ|nr:type I-F CRISPR-associated endoribonuclease Cas6/Csy4 [Acinetobacter bereziniae]ENV23283.1 CRISPR-associated protein cas6/csy4, subtype I-f/ypest [Acinetobacter bereziniae NIPH 3]MCV2441568.1 type I-F CRISPR-associated endoribonuclease Cas6/Csy4 [Acinetobacter bereziniae]
MDANYYLDIRVLESSDDTDLKLGHIRNQIYTVIHGAFRKLPAHYALAVEISDKLKAKQEMFEKKHGHSAKPNFDILRIFTEKQDELDQLIEAIKGHWKIRDYAVLSGVLAVPTAKISAWKSYRRFRIPTLKAERTQLTIASTPLRDRRLKTAKDMPYFKVISQSTGQGFTIIIDIQDSENAGYGMPDSYGLARKESPLALPVF